MTGLPAAVGENYGAVPRRAERVSDELDAFITAKQAAFRVAGHSNTFFVNHNIIKWLT